MMTRVKMRMKTKMQTYTPTSQPTWQQHWPHQSEPSAWGEVAQVQLRGMQAKGAQGLQGVTREVVVQGVSWATYRP